MSIQDANTKKLGQSASHNNYIYMVNYSCFNVLVPGSVILIQFLFVNKGRKSFYFTLKLLRKQFTSSSSLLYSYLHYISVVVIILVVVAGNDDGFTSSSSQITIDPTCLAMNMMTTLSQPLSGIQLPNCTYGGKFMRKIYKLLLCNLCRMPCLIFVGLLNKS